MNHSDQNADEASSKYSFPRSIAAKSSSSIFALLSLSFAESLSLESFYRKFFKESREIVPLIFLK